MRLISEVLVKFQNDTTSYLTILRSHRKTFCMILEGSSLDKISRYFFFGISRPSFREEAALLRRHDDVIKWKHFPRHWHFFRGIHRSPVNSPHQGQWHGTLIFSLICVWINEWVNNREADDLRRYCAHYDVIAMVLWNRNCMWWAKNMYLQSIWQWWVASHIDYILVARAVACYCLAKYQQRCIPKQFIISVSV